MGDQRVQNNRQATGITAAVALLVALLAPGTAVFAAESEDPNTTWSDDASFDNADYCDPTIYPEAANDPYCNPTLTDDTTGTTWSDDGSYDNADYCDPTIYPEAANDPYCNPTLTDDTTGTTWSDGASYDNADYCDPTIYPEAANDPYCNPTLTDDTTGTTAAAPAAEVVASRSTETAPTPLVELDPADASAVGAGRMLLAIDAIAELGGFERATTPAISTLLRDIRDGVPADGLDEAGYTAELERFVPDFISFLESLEANGTPVSDNLWTAAIELDIALFGGVPGEPAASIDAAQIQPRPWVAGLADLLVRDGQAPAAVSGYEDSVAIRSLLASFAAIEPETPTTTSTTEPIVEPSIPDALPFADDITGDGPSEGSPAVLVGIGAGIVAMLGAAALVLTRRRRRSSTTQSDGLQPEAHSSAPTTDTDNDRASVSELLEASRRLSASLDSAAIATIALSEARRLVGAEGGIVVRRTEAGLDPLGCEPPVLFDYERLQESSLNRVIETGRSTAAIVTDDPILVQVPMAMGAVPIVADGIVIGALLVVRVSAKPFGREDLDSLEMLAPLVGSALASADKHETAVDVEPLTGLQNRRRLDQDLAAISTDDAVAYVMVDIDHFKNFNDTNGHTAGDEALRQVSAILKASVRPKDLVYRYGGEEFCVLLPGATAQEAAVVAERARTAIEAAVIPGMEQQPAGCVTISVGISDTAFGTPSDLVERADAALYESKRNGRNQITISSPE